MSKPFSWDETDAQATNANDAATATLPEQDDFELPRNDQEIPRVCSILDPGCEACQ